MQRGGAASNSIFDPVLCEVLYNWYSPAGGVVLDPFAGGSVLGITAEMLGRHYIGIDLSERQKKGGGIVAKLTAKQQRFCDEYLIDLNATQAAIRAGYSKKTAKQIATENLSKPYLREYIDKRMAEKEAALIADQDEVMKYLTAVMRREKAEHVVVTCTEETCASKR